MTEGLYGFDGFFGLSPSWRKIGAPPLSMRGLFVNKKIVERWRCAYFGATWNDLPESGKSAESV